MKKILITLFLALLMTLIIGSFAMAADAVDWDALVDGGNAAAADTLALDIARTAENRSVSVAVDWGEILTKIVTYALGAVAMIIAAVLVYVIVKYLIPMLPAIVQWLSDKRLLWLARILVNAAEVAYGRFKGDEKLAKVYQWMNARGIQVTDEVKQMIDNAWQELNDKMIQLGLKAPAPVTGKDDPVPIE